MKKNKLFIIMVLLLLAFSVIGSAATSPVNIGLGDDLVVLPGSEALYSNPAVVNVDKTKFVLEFSGTANFWNNIFRNDIISEKDKERLNNIAKKNGFLLGIQGNPGLKMAIGPVLFFTEGKADALLRVSDDYAQLLINGNELERNYRIDGSNGAIALYLDSGISYSHKLDDKYLESFNSDDIQFSNFHLGLTYHYLLGGFFKYHGKGELGTSFGEDGEPLFIGNDGEINLYYPEINEFSDLAKGHAFDLGVYTDLNDRYSLGFSILNIGANLAVDKVKEDKLNFEYNYETEEWDIDDTTDLGIYVEEESVMKLPLIVKVGGKMELIRDLGLFANYTLTNYGDSIYEDGLRDHRLTLAAEYDRLKFLPLRTGISYSTLESNFAIAAGMGIHLGPIKLDAGVSDLTGLFYRSKGVSGGLKFSLEF